MTRLAAFLVLLLATGPATSAPWSIVGQTIIDRLAIDNPAPICAGLVIGEICELPWQVPFGSQLVIEGYAFEGHKTSAAPDPGFVIFPWLSDQRIEFSTVTDRLSGALHSCYSVDRTATCPVRFVVRGGAWVNLRLLAVPPADGFRRSWHLWGELISDP